MLKHMQIAVPPGIGDGVWALMKVQSILNAEGYDVATVAVCTGGPQRSDEFLRRFSFVRDVWYCPFSCTEAEFWTEDGVYNYAPSQREWHNQFHWLLVPNQHLEYGRRLDKWLPEYDTNWQIAEEYEFTAEETDYANRLRKRIGPFCVFYLGPENGNSEGSNAGHNRGALWTLSDWGQCYDWARSAGFEVVVVGADYDRLMWERVKPFMPDAHDAIGRWNISKTFAVIKQADFCLSYQSGIGIFATLMNVPTAIFWREHGNSIQSDRYVSFSEDMATAWVPPTHGPSDFAPLIYGRHHAEHAIESLSGFLGRS